MRRRRPSCNTFFCKASSWLVWGIGLLCCSVLWLVNVTCYYGPETWFWLTISQAEHSVCRWMESVWVTKGVPQGWASGHVWFTICTCDWTCWMPWIISMQMISCSRSLAFFNSVCLWPFQICLAQLKLVFNAGKSKVMLFLIHLFPHLKLLKGRAFELASTKHLGCIIDLGNFIQELHFKSAHQIKKKKSLFLSFYTADIGLLPPSVLSCQCFVF